MNKSPIKTTLIWILIGAAVGSLLGVAGLLGLISGDTLLKASSLTIKICIGLIVLIVDTLCITALIRQHIYRVIDKNGQTVTGRIETMRAISRPDQLAVDQWQRKSLFSFTVSYEAEGRTITKEFPPTPLTSRQELYPFSPDEGDEIDIRFLQGHPRMSIIDLEAIKKSTKAEQEGSRIHFIAIPFILTIVYITLFIIKLK